MTDKFSILRKIVLIVVVLLLVVAGVKYLQNRRQKANGNNGGAAPTIRYMNFEGGYTFKVPKDHAVDEQSVPGAQLVYTGQITAKTLEDVYTASGISIHPITDLTDHSGTAFKKYVNDTYVPDLKKNLSSNDVEVKFDKQNGDDVARISLKKDGQPFRFIYLKGGNHPVAVIAKQETDPFKNLTQSLQDTEKSEVKGEVEAIKQAVKSTAQLIKDQKAKELYASAAAGLREKNTEAELIAAMKAAAPFSDGNITISGATYISDEFSATMRFTKLDKNDQQPGFGELNFKKIDGQWKVQTVSLPNPTPTPAPAPAKKP